MDEAYADFAGDTSILFFSKRTILLLRQDFGKSIFLGWSRVGYAVSSPQIIEVLTMSERYTTRIGAQAAAHAALSTRVTLRIVRPKSSMKTKVNILYFLGWRNPRSKISFYRPFKRR